MPKVFYEPGCYKVRVMSQMFAEASTGNLMFVLKFNVLECKEPFNDNLPQYERKAFFTVTDKTYLRVIEEDLRAIGFKGRTLQQLHPNTPGFHDFSGKELEMYCTHDKDQAGELRERWLTRSDGLRPLTGMAKLDRLDAKFGRKVNDRESAPAVAEPAGITDDDVPF
jgi:hypothetical protein